MSDGGAVIGSLGSWICSSFLIQHSVADSSLVSVTFVGSRCGSEGRRGSQNAGLRDLLGGFGLLR